MVQLKRILLVDDDTDDQVFFRDAINEVNGSLECEVANNGREALAQIEIPPPPDLIFLDLNMPVMNGYECLEVLKSESRFKHIPVVIFTTSKNTKDIERSKKMGASVFLTKPANFELLCSKIDKILQLDLSQGQYAL